MRRKAGTGGSRWILLMHQIPPKPAYLRMKVGRRLQRLGAVAIKNSVYALPRSDGAREDFQWTLREVRKGGGDAMVCEAHFVEGLTDDAVEQLFVDARNSDYRDLAAAARRGSAADLGRLRRRFEELAAIDFFSAPGRKQAEAALRTVEARLKPGTPKPGASGDPLRREDYRGRTWVTRTGIHVDRMACAWLIRRFIDPKARFGFVPARGHVPGKGELRFDMFEGEFTHEGDRCSFETLLVRFAIDDPALREIGEIIHDIDFKDGKYRREEAAGLERILAGISMARKDDAGRLERASAVFDDLHESFRRKAR